MKTRLLGAAVLFALAVIFVPMFFSSSPTSSAGDETVSLAIPPAPDRDLQTKTMSLTPGAATSSTVAPAPKPAVAVPPASSAATPVGGNQLATVNIGSSRPRDVETDPTAGQKPEPTTVTQPGSSASQPVIPAQVKGSATSSAIKPGAAAAVVPAQASSQPAIPAATGAHGQYSINLSAYASTASAQGLIQRVRALGYPAAGRTINQGGKQLTLVTAGPFDSRTAAESARLKITQTIPGAPARLEGGATTPTQDDPPTAAPASAAAGATPPSRAGGWAVQVAAMGSQADANALRDKLRANGFDGYVDTVNASGKQLWRVRAGPQTQRADAVRIRDQIKTKLGVDGNVVSAP